jgi:cbb3-type cytochrome oxidase cytochrome c subunit
VRRLLLLGLVVAAAALVPAAAAKVSYCAPTGDYCTSVKKVKGVRMLNITSFAFNGRVKICVAKGGRVCHSFRLTKTGPAYGLNIRWARHYPNRGAGTYRVSFFLGTTRLGPVLTFVR